MANENAEKIADIMTAIKNRPNKEELPVPARELLMVTIHNPNELMNIPQRDLIMGLHDMVPSMVSSSFENGVVSDRIASLIPVISDEEEEDFF